MRDEAVRKGGAGQGFAYRDSIMENGPNERGSPTRTRIASEGMKKPAAGGVPFAGFSLQDFVVSDQPIRAPQQLQERAGA